MTGYELWDTETRNLISDYGSEAEALDAVAALAQERGADAVQVLTLVRVGPRGGLKRLASGAALRALAVRSVKSLA